MPAATAAMETELVSRHGEGQRARIHRGLEQVADYWRARDGDRAIFEGFVRANFASDQATLDTTFERFEFLLEKLYGHANEISLAMSRQTDLDLGPILPMDRISAAYSVADHFREDFFANKLAFTVLLNFPITTLEQRLAEGESWSRRQWAEARLALRYARRLPTEVQQAVSQAGAEADQYIADYNIYMHHLVDDNGKRLFPPGLRLLSHWNLRDEIKADYSDPEAGLAKQRTIQRVMERIVDQSIPQVVINNPHVDWDPFSNKVTPAAVSDTDAQVPLDLQAAEAPEPDTRYRIWLNNFHAEQQVDRYSPSAPTHIARVFDEGREISEGQAEAMFRQILASPLLGRVAEVVEKRLGRPLEPFDIWYVGFRPRGAYTEEELNAITRGRYPTPQAYDADIPRMLGALGFPADRAREIAAQITVDPARGSGHAWPLGMHGAQSHLRTRVGADGMDYKGYNIAVHEMGHNVEQVISLEEVDHYLLRGVPNTAFTEALAFVFQDRDLELLGLADADEESRALMVLDSFWGGAEITAVALVDMRAWRWMYEHPEATPAQFREAVLQIAKDVWNESFGPVTGVRDVTLLAVYSHMISNRLYIPNYAIGQMIAAQIEGHITRADALGVEFERMCRTGNVTPDMWMKAATGDPVGPQALLRATQRALEALGGL
ncbi:MAG: hypothetical protein JSW21_08760 [Gammaproteobacteria bacterium]|nr:MAG: hypothetical protein JSW21_08760 [Gammaproteobacteria bacterium]